VCPPLGCRLLAFRQLYEAIKVRISLYFHAYGTLHDSTYAVVGGCSPPANLIVASKLTIYLQCAALCMCIQICVFSVRKYSTRLTGYLIEFVSPLWIQHFSHDVSVITNKKLQVVFRNVYRIQQRPTEKGKMDVTCG